MRIMVFDVPAESGGALTILNQYYDDAIKSEKNEWFFVVSTPRLDNCENVKILNYPWIKRTWFHRLYFEKFIAHRLVKKYKVDEVLSLQNTIISHVKIKQTLYLHQPLPFVEKKYRITENLRFWFYQNIISQMIYKSISKANLVIVQTKWIMNAAIEKTGVCEKKFVLKQPEINVKIKNLYESKENTTLFFYPANGLIYKNHEAIVEACKILKNKNINNYKVIFTLIGNENNHTSKLKKIIETECLPIEYIGIIDIEKVYKYYSKSILLFPSYIETFGLPLLEAKMHQAPIIASNCAFSHEILDRYNKVQFFDPFDSVNLSIAMGVYIKT